MLSECVTYAINRFGCAVKITNSDGTEENFKAFIQPLRHKDHSFYGGKCAETGFTVGANFLYIGPKNVRIDQYPFNTILKTNEESYIVKRAQKVCFKNKILYIWAILQRCDEQIMYTM